MLRARKVDEYFETSHETYQNVLEYILYNATLYGNTPLFNQVYIPVKRYDTTTQKLADGYTYLNCGMSTSELADLYWARYSGTYLIGRTSVLTDDADKVILRAKAVFNENRGKYLKMIELAGLEWNPLWNVDGIELHQILEQHADEISKDTGSGESFKGQNLQVQHNVAAYDASTKTEWTETNTGKDSSQTPSASSTVGDISVTSTTGSIPSVSESEASASSSVNVRTHATIQYAVPIKDTAFGTALTGGDTLHTEKNVKQGNIGVTETTTLLNHARDYLRFSIVQEFFKDINKVIHIGIYGDIAPVPWWCYGGGGTTPVHPDTGRTTSVHNNSYDMIQSVELDEYGHVIGLTTCDGVTKVFTPMTQAQYEQTDPKDQSLYMIYE